jgi:hypothetical protein
VTLDYEGRYGQNPIWTTDQFLDAAIESLRPTVQTAAPAGRGGRAGGAPAGNQNQGRGRQ